MWAFAGKRDVKKGFSLLECAANSGSVAAHYDLGYCSDIRRGTKEDVIRSVKHFKARAEAGHQESLIRFARCLIDGIGVRKHSEYGLALLRTAANAGMESSTWELVRILKYRRGVECNWEGSFRWYLGLAKKSHSGAVHRL